MNLKVYEIAYDETLTVDGTVAAQIVSYDVIFSDQGPQGIQGIQGIQGPTGTSALTNQGDILYRNATVPDRLPIGTAGQFLKVNTGATAPEWATITKSTVGLGNVDNTSDSNKPVSTATQAALDLKANLASPTFTGTVSGITKSMVGLGNVDNTSDANKPISSATQTALDGKASSAAAVPSGGTTGQILRKKTNSNYDTEWSAETIAVPTSRTISAGTGLTGGGDLSANRTLTVSYGTTEGTACQGNDSRLSDSRTPTSHASSHQASGSDQITSLDMTSLTVTNASTSPQVKLKAKTFFGNSTGTAGILAEATSAFGPEPAFGFTGVNEAVSVYRNIGFTGNGTSQLILNTNGNIAMLHAFPTESLDINGNLLLRDASAESQASYTGVPDGANSEVTIEALAFGVSGNDIEITFDGDELTINDAIFIWNEANPSNRAHLTGGDGTQIPDAGSIFLSGGVSASVKFNVLGSFTGYRTYNLQDSSGTLALTEQAIDYEVTDATKGIILKSPDNSRWRITIDNDGNLSSTKL